MEFEYDTFGAPDARPLLLIAGLGAQLTSWREGFRDRLASEGFWVIRFDNRDTGLSSDLDGLPVPGIADIASGDALAPYSLDDMADDAAAILRALGIGAAHVAGASMGGYIAQLVAIRHPELVRSLTLIMTAPGSIADDASATPEAALALLAPPPPDREGMIEHSVRASRVLWGERYFDEAEARRRAAEAIDRAARPKGTQRQFAAIAAAPPRTAGLRGLRVPTLVVHGDADPLIPIENGRRLVAAIPGARLMVMRGAGHELPSALWPDVARAMAANAVRDGASTDS
jgi:pimeloyl-ACP methyl ester carboxylesterase